MSILIFITRVISPYQRYILILPFLTIFLSAGAIASVSFGGHHPEDVELSISYLEDTEGEFNVEDIGYNQRPFSPLEGSIPNFGFTDSVFWLKFDIKNLNTVNKQLMLRLHQRHLLKIYLQQGDGDDVSFLQLARYDLDEGINENPVDDHFITVPIAIDSMQAVTLLIQHGSYHSTLLEFELLEQQEYSQKILAEHIFQAICSGVMVTLIIISLFQFFAFKRLSYLFYALQELAIITSFFVVEKWDQLYLWPNWLGVHEFLEIGTTHFIIIFSTLFCRYFINTRKLSVKLDRLLLTIALISLFTVIVIQPLSLTISTIIFSVNYLASVIVIFSATIYAKIRGMAYTRFYLLGWVFLFIPSILVVLQGVGLEFSLPLSTTEAIKLGYLMEAICFMFALYDQLKIINSNHNALQEENIKIINERIEEQENLLDVERERNAFFLETKKSLEYIASTSHDLNQPIHSLRLSLKGLETKYDITLLEGHIDNVLTFFEDLNNNVIRQAKDQYINLHYTFTMDSLFEEVRQRMEPKLNNKRIQLCFAPCSIVCYQSKVVLIRIIENLLSNAIRYTKEGKILIGVRRRKRAYEIQIIDTGSGIHKSRIEEMLSPFRQHEDNPDASGYGLGLAIVKRLCDENQYVFSIQSTVNKGTMAGISIPVDY